jgi:hypothetical protein
VVRLIDERLEERGEGCSIVLNIAFAEENKTGGRNQ